MNVINQSNNAAFFETDIVLTSFFFVFIFYRTLQGLNPLGSKMYYKKPTQKRGIVHVFLNDPLSTTQPAKGLVKVI